MVEVQELAGAALPVKAPFAGYRIEALLGRGGMGVVYLAEDPVLQRRVALKLLAPELCGDPGFRERLRRESRLAASIEHPNVIPIYEAGEADGALFIAMRYVEGADLGRLLAEEGALEIGQALDLLAQVAEGLDATHARGLVHRDVKPSNVLIATRGGREHVYLADFGLTQIGASADDAARAAHLSGTADYLAPEQITAGVAGAPADLYALGCLLYETLTGAVPYPRASELETLWAHVDEPPPKPTEVRPELPEALDRVVARALAKDPAERHASAAELAAAVRGALRMPDAATSTSCAAGGTTTTAGTSTTAASTSAIVATPAGWSRCSMQTGAGAARRSRSAPEGVSLRRRGAGARRPSR